MMADRAQPRITRPFATREDLSPITRVRSLWFQHLSSCSTAPNHAFVRALRWEDRTPRSERALRRNRGLVTWRPSLDLSPARGHEFSNTNYSTLMPMLLTVRAGPLKGAVTTAWISLPFLTTTMRRFKTPPT